MGFLSTAANVVAPGLGAAPNLLGLGPQPGTQLPSASGFAPDSETNSAVQNFSNYANQPGGNFQQQALSGTNNSAQVQNPQELQRQRTELGGPNNNSALAGAISAKQNNQYQQNYAQTQTQAQLNAPLQQMQAMQQAESALYAQDQTAYQQAQLQTQTALNQAQVRTQAISSLFGGIGAIGGMAVKSAMNN